MPKLKDLTGQRFGHLAVMEKTEQRKNGYVLWRCRCDCGSELLVSSRSLANGIVSDCGCVPRKTARRGNVAEDLTGRRFGILTVVERCGNRNGRAVWRCRCDCGGEKLVTAHALKSGGCRSCGCLKHRAGRNISDLTGQKFGRLTPLYPTEKRDSKNSVYWNCRCDCGNIVEVTQSNLVYGTYRSCGCLRREHQSNLSSNLHVIDGTCIEFLDKEKPRSDNTSGTNGVCRMKNNRYRVDIGFKGKRMYVGTFDQYEDAVRARKEAEEKIHKGFTAAWHRWKSEGGGDPEWEKEHPLLYEVRKEHGVFVIESNYEEACRGRDEV
ncbi:MAG: transcriptional regulator [Clostridiales bacterium]|nr:transcriptional regulator [Clostridiales bacterium]